MIVATISKMCPDLKGFEVSMLCRIFSFAVFSLEQMKFEEMWFFRRFEVESLILEDEPKVRRFEVWFYINSLIHVRGSEFSGSFPDSI